MIFGSLTLDWFRPGRFLTLKIFERQNQYEWDLLGRRRGEAAPHSLVRVSVRGGSAGIALFNIDAFSGQLFS